MHDARPNGLTNLIIRASAGTGKTFQLAHRFIALLLDGAPADRILATTFTRKAAGEILDRVVVRLAEAVIDEQARCDMGSIIGSPDVSGESCLEMLRGLIARLYRLRISTLDSFFMQIAQTQALELGLPPNWRIVDQLEDGLLRDEALEAMFRSGGTTELVALTQLLTKGEASRGIGDLVQAIVSDLHPLFLDTNASAWKSLTHGKPLGEAELSDLLNRIAAVPLDGKSLTKARDEDVERAMGEDWATLIEKGLAAKVAAGETTYRRKPIPDDVVSLYGKLVEHARALLVQRVARQTEGSYELLAAFDRQFRSLQQRQRVLRFGDVARTLARQGASIQHADVAADGSLERMAFRLDGGIDHVLLDEFQDTAPEQWRAIQGLAEHVCSQDPQRSFFCVGDVKQAIYGWRGGVAEIFDVVGTQLPGLDHQSLNRSYRSSPAVIDAVNGVFTQLARHPNLGRAERAVKAWSGRFEKHDTARTDLSGYVCLRTVPEAGETQAQSDVLLDFAATEAARIRSESRGASVGILVRTNRTVGALMARLRQLHVPASEEGGNPIVDAASVQLVLSLLRLADHPSDTVSRFHLANSPLGDALGFVDPFDDSAAILLAARVHRTLLERGYGRSMLDWTHPLVPIASERERRRIEQLVELAYVYQPNATLRADDFVQFVEFQRVSEPAAAAVRIMTIHQAKGLEFDVVILPELEARLLGQPDSFVVHRPDPTKPADRVCRYASDSIQRLLPAAVQQMFADATDREATESLCVLYVALTRAVHSLHLLINPSAGNERSLSATYAGLLRAALHGTEPVPAGEILFETGSPNWFEHLEREPTPTHPARRAESKPSVSPLRLAADLDHRQRGLPRVSPSALEGGSNVSIGSVLTHGSGVPMLRGSIIHAWFERITWIDSDGPPDESEMKSIARRITNSARSATALELGGLIREFRRMLSRREIADLLNHNAQLQRVQQRCPEVSRSSDRLRLTVENERAFAVREGHSLLTGSIDRFVSVYEGDQLVAADVVDFKTDSVSAEDPAELSKRVAHYRPQIEAYRRAVASMTGLTPKRIGARLVFVGLGSVQEVAG